MNEKNLEYLKDNIKYLGFGESQHAALEHHLKEGNNSFQLSYAAEINKKPFQAELQFRKSNNADMYFLNSMMLHLKEPTVKRRSKPFT